MVQADIYRAMLDIWKRETVQHFIDLKEQSHYWLLWISSKVVNAARIRCVYGYISVTYEEYVKSSRHDNYIWPRQFNLMYSVVKCVFADQNGTSCIDELRGCQRSNSLAESSQEAPWSLSTIWLRLPSKLGALTSDSTYCTHRIFDAKVK